MQFKDGNIQNTMSPRKYCSFYIIEVSGPRTDRDDMKKKTGKHIAINRGQKLWSAK